MLIQSNLFNLTSTFSALLQSGIPSMEATRQDAVGFRNRFLTYAGEQHLPLNTLEVTEVERNLGEEDFPAIRYSIVVTGPLQPLIGDRDFWRHDISTDDWQTLASTPDGVDLGGSLAWDGSDTIFALRGDNNYDFWKYSISASAWTILTDTPDQVNHGGSLVYFSGYLYALRGDSKKDFWRYSLAQNTWQSLASVSGSVKEGGSLASLGGDHIFALRGGGKDDFWRYSISADQWVSLADTPDKIDDGGSLVLLDGRLYALRGDNKKEFWELAASE